MKMTFEFDNFDQLYEFCEIALERKLSEKRMFEALGLNIRFLNLSMRSKNLLQAAEINTIGQLVKLTYSQLLLIPGMGSISTDEVVHSLRVKGFRLKEAE